jgi:hypothetical protein
MIPGLSIADNEIDLSLSRKSALPDRPGGFSQQV